jgi:filamentous hemagglutinin family protein
MGRFMKQYFIGLMLGMISFNIYANPVLDNVGAGNVTVQQTNNSTVVNQASQQAIINWQSFNIGQGESTHFQQPTGGIALNRINPTQGASSIYGSLTATGQIVLVNPAGIYFAPGAFVSVGGLIATTSNISDQDFLNNHFRFTRDPNYSGSIINEGQIIAATHGLIALVGSSVTNKGLVQAELGNVILASGSAFTINFAGDHLINFTIDEKATGASPGVTNTNTGVISANGGQVLVTAKAAQNVLDQVINMEGVVEARSVAQKNGEIIFSGDTDAGIVRVAAKVDASGKNVNEKGGNVKITGYNIAIDDGANLDVSGDIGGGNINIGGSYQGNGPLPNANAIWMSNLSQLNADAITNGNGGNIIVWSDHRTVAQGSITARGGAVSGDGGFVETSGKDYLNANHVLVNTSAANGKRGTWLLDPTDLTISNAADSNVIVGVNTFTGDGDFAASNLNVTTLQNALATNNILVQTTAGGAGGGAGNITVDDAITWNAATTLTLDAFNSIIINDPITATNGGLSLNANAASQVNQDITVGLNLTLDGPATYTFTGAIAGNGGLIKNGAGTAILVNNTYNGSTTINAGTVQSNSFDVIPDTSAVTIAAGATFDLNGNSETIGSLSGAGDVTTGGGFLTTGGDNSSTTYSGVISEAGGLIKEGTGTLTLSGNNTYTGSTTINAGTLRMGIANALSNSTAVGIANVAGATWDLNNFNQTVNVIGLGGATGGNILLGSATLTFGGAANFTYGGVISGTGSIIKQGTGIQTFTNTQTYTGSTTINDGTLRLGANNIFSNTSSISIANVAGATLDLNGFNDTINVISGGGGVGGTIALGAGTLTTGDSTSNTFAGVISGAGNIVKQGSGTWTLSGNNTYSGLTTINAGVLNAASANALGTTAGGTVVNSGGTLLLTGATIGAEDVTLNNGTLSGSGTSSLSGDITLSTGTSDIIQANSGADLTLSGNINGAAGLTLQGAGTLNLTGSLGNTTELSSLTSNLTSALNISGSITTTGSQIYNNSINLTGATAFTVFGDGTNSNFSLSFNGITGNQNVTLAGGLIGNYTFTLGGTLVVNNVTIEGGGGSATNALVLNESGNQTWNITGANQGNVTGVSGVGGTLSFLNMQNLTGGTGNNNFVFADNASVSGTINGRSLSNTNTLNFSAYTTAHTVVLSDTNSGLVRNSSGNVIANFSNINNLIGNNLLNEITLPNKRNTLTITDARIGFLNDPINFNGYQIFRSVSGLDQLLFTIAASLNTANGTAIVNGVTLYFINFNFLSAADVAPIILQSLYVPPVLGNRWAWTDELEENFQDILNQQFDEDGRLLNRLKIDLNCT